MTMKKNTQSKPAEELYLQVWRNPIFYEGLLSILTAEDWHTLTALAVFIDDKGRCYPKLERLGQILGLNNIASVSRRIKSLKAKYFRGNPVLVVEKHKKPTKKGSLIFDNNQYYLNPEIVSIFSPHPKTLGCRKEQMEKFLNARQKFINSFSMNPKRETNNITRAILKQEI